MEATETQLAALAVRIEAQETKVGELEQQIREAIEAAKPRSVLLCWQSLLDSATSGLQGLRGEKAALINERAALIKKQGDIEVALINERTEFIKKQGDIERAALAFRVDKDQIITGVIQNMKKLLEERDNSRSDSETSSVSERDEQKHAAFRDKIVARDQRCVLTESKPTSCEAAHIIPWAFHRKNEALWWHLFEPHCFNPADAAFDVRNGLLLRDDLNELFGMYLFTIVASSDDGEYQVIVSDLDAQVLPNDLDNQITAELRGYNGKIITFVGNQNQWPALEFLKHHNDVFTFRQESRKASSNLLSRDTN